MDEDVMRHIAQMPWPSRVKETFQRIERAGGHAWVVGGAVRDWVWAPDTVREDAVDWDLTVDLPAEALAPLRSQVHSGERFGTFWLAPGIEATPLRVDGSYSDQRHPDQIGPANTIDEDLRRRDFTVNAVAFDGHQVVAVPGALEDLRERRLRAVGDPGTRFSEDPLRILRLVRLASTRQAWVEENTARAAQAKVGLTETVSRERRLAEFLAFVAGDKAGWPLWDHWGLLSTIDWPPMVRTVHREMTRIPPHPLSRLVCYALTRYDDVSFLHRWGENWPLRREWRRALGDLAHTDQDAMAWAMRARDGENGSRWLFNDLAQAVGLAAETLNPSVLAIRATEVRELANVTGVELGRALRFLRHRIVAYPEDNYRERLLELLAEWHSRDL